MPHWTVNTLNNVGKLPYELQREVYNLIDFDTKLSVVMDRYPTMQRYSQQPDVAETSNVNDIFEWFTEKELSVIYRQGYLCKLFQYNERSRRWQLSPTFLSILPTITMRGYSYATIANMSEEPQQINITHPVYDMIERLRTQDIGSVKTRLILSLSVMMHTDVGDMKFNYYIRKVAYQIIVASNVYKRTCVKARIRREAEQQLLSLAKEQARLERMAQREIEIEQERIRIQAEKEQLREQEREQARLEKDAQLAAKVQEREAKAQQKIALQRKKEENRAQQAEQKITLQKEKEETKRNKLANKLEKENIQRERVEQKNIQKQAKLDKKQMALDAKQRKAQAISEKKEKIKQIQQQKLYDQSLTYVCKLFKTIK